MSFAGSNPQLLTPESSQHAGPEDTSTPGEWAHNTSTYTPTDTMTPVHTNPSRKRSRDESAFEIAGENSYFSFPSSVQQVSTPAPIPEEEPIYGEGMVLLNPKTGTPLAAESQTGTWWEEKVAEEEEARKKLIEGAAADQAERLARPAMSLSRKSIRMSQSSIRADMESILPSGAPASPPKQSNDSTEIDAATLALGIGWTKMATEDPDLQAAARGWTKYIENHYSSIHGAEILLKSRSLNAYLVSSEEGFFLFSDDLLESKLVGKTWGLALQNLRAVPIVFEGDDVLRAERTPGPDSSAGLTMTPHNSSSAAFVNALNGHAASTKVEPNSHTGMDLD